MTIQEKATKALDWFERKQRGDERIWVTKDGKPEWIVDMCRDAHDCGEMLPDDRRYEFIVEMLSEIEEADDPDEINIEADIYTYELTAWLASRVDRASYCDMAQEEGLVSPDAPVWTRLAVGQYMEKKEVLQSLIGSLKNLDDEELAA